MMAITTSSSISVKPSLLRADRFMKHVLSVGLIRGEVSEIRPRGLRDRYRTRA